MASKRKFKVGDKVTIVEGHSRVSKDLNDVQGVVKSYPKRYRASDKFTVYVQLISVPRTVLLWEDELKLTEVSGVEFKVGDKVRVIGNKLPDGTRDYHCFEIGEEVDIIKTKIDDSNYGKSVLCERSSDGMKQTISIKDIELVSSTATTKQERVKKLTKIATTVNITDKNQIVGQDVAKTELGVAIAHDMPVLLVGDTGTGKTSIVRELALNNNKPFSRFNLTGETTVDDFVGKYTLFEGNTVWQDGILLQAMKKGHWLVVDEINAALPEILFALHSLLDDDKFVVVPQKDGEIVKPHNDFRFFATMNPVDEYAGTKDLNKAFKSRFNMIINVDYPERDIEIEIVKQKCKLEEVIARQIVDVGQLARKAKTDDEIFYTCSTRDLIQWGNLAQALPLDQAFKLSVLNKANGDGGKLKAMYETVVGAYKSASDKGYSLSIDFFNDKIDEIEKAQTDLKIREDSFEKYKEKLVEDVRTETVKKLVDSASDVTERLTPEKKATKAEVEKSIKADLSQVDY